MKTSKSVLTLIFSFMYLSSSVSLAYTREELSELELPRIESEEYIYKTDMQQAFLNSLKESPEDLKQQIEKVKKVLNKSRMNLEIFKADIKKAELAKIYAESNTTISVKTAVSSIITLTTISLLFVQIFNDQVNRVLSSKTVNSIKALTKLVPNKSNEKINLFVQNFEEKLSQASSLKRAGYFNWGITYLVFTFAAYEAWISNSSDRIELNLTRKNCDKIYELSSQLERHIRVKENELNILESIIEMRKQQ